MKVEQQKKSHQTLQSLQLQGIVARMKINEIALPSFQRDFVWSTKHVQELLDSLYKNYPIGSIYLWEPGDESEIPPMRFFNESNENPYAKLIIDGQQRLFSLYQVKESSFDDGKNGKIRFYFNPKTKRFTLSPKNSYEVGILWKSGLDRFEEDFETLDFYKPVREGIESAKTKLKKANESQDKSRIEKAEAVLSGWLEQKEELLRVARMLEQNSITVVNLTNTPLREVIDIFTRINKQGERLTIEEALLVPLMESVSPGIKGLIDKTIKRSPYRGTTYNLNTFYEAVFAYFRARKEVLRGKEMTVIEILKKNDLSEEEIAQAKKVVEESVDTLYWGMMKSVAVMRNFGVASERMFPSSVVMTVLSIAFGKEFAAWKRGRKISTEPLQGWIKEFSDYPSAEEYLAHHLSKISWGSDTEALARLYYVYANATFRYSGGISTIYSGSNQSRRDGDVRLMINKEKSLRDLLASIMNHIAADLQDMGEPYREYRITTEDLSKRRYTGGARSDSFFITLLGLAEKYNGAFDGRKGSFDPLDLSKANIHHIIPRSWFKVFEKDEEEGGEISSYDSIGNLTWVSAEANTFYDDSEPVEYLTSSGAKYLGAPQVENFFAKRFMGREYRINLLENSSKDNHAHSLRIRNQERIGKMAEGMNSLLRQLERDAGFGWENTELITQRSSQ